MPSIGFDFLIAYVSSPFALMGPKSSSTFRRTLSTRPNSPLPRSSSSISNSRSNLPGHSSPDTTGWAYRMHVRCFSGLGPIGPRPDFKNRGEVGEVTVELDDEEAERCWSLDNRPGFEAESWRLGKRGGGRCHSSTIKPRSATETGHSPKMIRYLCLSVASESQR